MEKLQKGVELFKAATGSAPQDVRYTTGNTGSSATGLSASDIEEQKCKRWNSWSIADYSFRIRCLSLLKKNKMAKKNY